MNKALDIGHMDTSNESCLKTQVKVVQQNDNYHSFLWLFSESYREKKKHLTYSACNPVTTVNSCSCSVMPKYIFFFKFYITVWMWWGSLCVNQSSLMQLYLDLLETELSSWLPNTSDHAAQLTTSSLLQSYYRKQKNIFRSLLNAFQRFRLSFVSSRDWFGVSGFAQVDCSVSQYSLFSSGYFTSPVRLSVVRFRAALDEFRAQVIPLMIKNSDTRFAHIHPHFETAWLSH